MSCSISGEGIPAHNYPETLLHNCWQNKGSLVGSQFVMFDKIIEFQVSLIAVVKS